MSRSRKRTQVGPQAQPPPPCPSAQCLLVRLQAITDIKKLGCRKAMRKFDRLTLLVSGGLSETRARRAPWALALEPEGRDPGHSPAASLPGHGLGPPPLGAPFLLSLEEGPDP